MYRLVVQYTCISLLFFDLRCMLVNWGRLLILGLLYIAGGTAKHCIDQYMVLFRYCSLEGNTAIPGRAGYMLGFAMHF